MSDLHIVHISSYNAERSHDWLGEVDAQTTRFGKRKVSVPHREYEVNVIEAATGSALRMRSG